MNWITLGYRDLRGLFLYGDGWGGIFHISTGFQCRIHRLYPNPHITDNPKRKRHMFYYPETVEEK